MPQSLELALRVRADLDRAIRDLQRLERTVDRTGDEARGSGRDFSRMNRELDRTAVSVERTNRAMAGLPGVARAAGAAIASLGLARAAREYVEAVDELTRVRSLLRLVTEDQEELARVEASLFSLAQRTRSEYAATGELYARVARATEELNVQQTDLLRVAQAVNQAIKISGASFQEAAAGVLQFSQGLAAGRLQGENLGSVLEATPRLAQAIAEGLGVTVGQLRELGAQGELAADRVFGAVLSQAAKLEAEFAQIESTVGDSFTLLRNELQETAGDFDRVTGATSAFAGAIDSITASVAAISDRDLERLAAVGRAFVGGGFSTGAAAAGAAALDAAVERATRLATRLGGAGRFGLEETPDDAPVAPESTAEQAAALTSQISERALDRLRRAEIEQLEASERAIAAAERRRDQLLALVDEEAEGYEEYARRVQAVYEEDIANAAEAAAEAEAQAAEQTREVIERQAVARERLLDQVRDVETQLLGSYERQIVEIDRWRDETIAALRDVGGAEEDLARVTEAAEEARARAREQNARDLEEEAEAARRAARDARSGAERALEDIENIATDTASNVEGAIRSSFQALEDVLVDFVRTGKLQFSDLVDHILAELARVAIRELVLGPLTSALRGAFGGVDAGVGHGGGIAGSLAQRRVVPLAAFAAAPRLHRGGILPGEVPTILRPGEGVFTPEQMRALGASMGGPQSVRVEIRNEGAPQRIVDGRAQADQGEVVIGLVTEDVHRNGAFTQTLAQTFNLRRRGV